MHRLGIISQLDRAAMAAYRQAYGRWVEAERAMRHLRPQWGSEPEPVDEFFGD
jgi:hypothetical protein